MQIVFMSPDDPFYLPKFYSYVFDHLTSEHEVKVIIVPPLYAGTTKFDIGIRYAKTFGLKEAGILSYRVIFYKIMDSIFNGKGNKFYSLRAAFHRYHIPHLYEEDVNSKRNIKRLKDWNTDLLISISCPQIFKKELLELPRKGCLNLHGSLLPEYRGVMPSFWMLANNDKQAGMTLFFVNEKIDAGDVLIQKEFPIQLDDTLDSFIRRSKRIGAQMVIDGIERINTGKFEVKPLDMSKGKYYGWPKKEDVKRFVSLGRRFR
jgi:methionyl-tRNA formyltransferase